jgi:hypothetical protein
MKSYSIAGNNSDVQLKTQFKTLSLSIVEIAKLHGIKIVPYNEENLALFSQHTHDSQKRILSALEIYLNIHLNIINSGGSIFDSSQIVWSALKSLGYRPTSDLFGHLGSEDIVEIHNSSLFQEFRNLNFFKFCSYSIEELYCENLHELYERDEKTEQAIIDFAKNIFSGKITTTVATEFPTHYIYEKKGQKFIIEDKIKVIAPLFDLHSSNKVPIGTIVFESAKLINSEKINSPIDLHF